MRVSGISSPSALRHPDRSDVRVWSVSVDRAFFEVLGQYPLAGGFTDDHYAPAAVEVGVRPAIVSHAFWRQWLAGNPAAIGQVVDMVGSRAALLRAWIAGQGAAHPGNSDRPAETEHPPSCEVARGGAGSFCSCLTKTDFARPESKTATAGSS
jgi:hypothetical protein